MTNEYKLLCCPFCGELPIITKHHREEMYAFMHRCEVLGPIARDFREDPMWHVEMWNTRVAADPQSPALGGELEVFVREVFLRNGFTIKEGQNDLKPYVYAAAKDLTAPLQAEVERLKDRYNRDAHGLNNEGDPIGGDPAGGYINDLRSARSEIDQLKARRDELEGLLKSGSSPTHGHCEAVLDALSKPAGSEQ